MLHGTVRPGLVRASARRECIQSTTHGSLWRAECDVASANGSNGLLPEACIKTYKAYTIVYTMREAKGAR